VRLNERYIIFECVKRGLSREETNRHLSNHNFKQVNDLDFLVWKDYLVPVSLGDPHIETAVIDHGATLSDIGRYLKKEFDNRGGVS